MAAGGPLGPGRPSIFYCREHAVLAREVRRALAGMAVHASGNARPSVQAGMSGAVVHGHLASHTFKRREKEWLISSLKTA